MVQVQPDSPTWKTSKAQPKNETLVKTGKSMDKVIIVDLRLGASKKRESSKLTGSMPKSKRQSNSRLKASPVPSLVIRTNMFNRVGVSGKAISTKKQRIKRPTDYFSNKPASNKGSNRDEMNEDKSFSTVKIQKDMRSYSKSVVLMEEEITPLSSTSY